MPYSNIDKGSNYFRIKTYTGDGTSGRSITFDETTNMQPDFVWYKSRSNAYNHGLFDSVRGTTKFLISNTNDSESTLSGVTSFNSNGFTVGSDAGSNGNGATFCSWSWKANGTGVSNTAGTISSTVSVNTTSGFSIVSYTGNGTTGATIGHGLGVVPNIMIVKRRTGVSDWRFYHSYLGSTYHLEMNDIGGSTLSSISWNNTSPTSSVFTVGSSGAVNNSGDTFIAYCFAEVKGFSKAFSYTGNGSTDGTFVYTGFMPKFIMIKRTDSTDSPWAIYDTVRDTNNPNTFLLRANTSNAEADDSGYSDHDHLSNGFKLRQTWTGINASGGTYIGFAIAENPFVSSKGIPCTAR